jgi:hypothetical protein
VEWRQLRLSLRSASLGALRRKRREVWRRSVAAIDRRDRFVLMLACSGTASGSRRPDMTVICRGPKNPTMIREKRDDWPNNGDN